MKRVFVLLLMLCCCLAAQAQADRREVRAGNRKFARDRFREAEIDYRKAVVRDSLSLPAQYNLASALYRQEDYPGAAEALSAVSGQENLPARYHYNSGDVALQQKDYAAAVEAFKQALLLDPGDLDAKENYIYAKKMLENQQGGGGGGDSRQDQDQDQDQQDQNQDQQDDQDRNQDQQDQNQQDQQPQMSPQQAQQMLRAIQAMERETQDKVNREKAAQLQSRQKEKNW